MVGGGGTHIATFTLQWPSSSLNTTSSPHLSLPDPRSHTHPTCTHTHSNTCLNSDHSTSPSYTTHPLHPSLPHSLPSPCDRKQRSRHFWLMEVGSHKRNSIEFLHSHVCVQYISLWHPQDCFKGQKWKLSMDQSSQQEQACRFVAIIFNGKIDQKPSWNQITKLCFRVI